jgi:hypothetical protein
MGSAASLTAGNGFPECEGQAIGFIAPSADPMPHRNMASWPKRNIYTM